MLQLHIMLIACLVSLVTVLPGTFLVLQNSAFMSDAISHAILPGIVIMFLWIKHLDSPLLLIGASLAGLCSVLLTQLLIQTDRIKKDAAIGLVFPLFFSVGVILISLYARNVHIDADMVLLGELAFAPFNRFVFHSYDLGPTALWSLGAIGIFTAAIITIFFKEFVLVSFDKEYAQTNGFSPQILFYSIMALTSIVAVGAFDSVGSIVTIALMIIPPAGALLLCTQVKPLIVTSMGISVSASLTGYCISHLADVSIAGSIAVANGIFFIIIFFIAPHRGLLAYFYRNNRQKHEWAEAILCTTLLKKAVSVHTLAKELNWSLSYTHTVVANVTRKGELIVRGDILTLSPEGKIRAEKNYTHF